MPVVDSEADIAARLLAMFEGAGALRVEPGYLQPADVLLDLYGENIRARAYRTDDPVHGEQMLRPDFTVPVVQMHMEERCEPARYTYAGPVWRRQEYGSSRAREYWQVGLELFGDSDPATADAEVFSSIATALNGVEFDVMTGDLAFLLAGIDALRTTDARKTALRRHVWRPSRFDRLIDRFAGKVPFDCDTRDLPDDVPAAIDAEGPAIGLRRAAEIAARIEALREERATPDLSNEEVAMIQTLMAVAGGSGSCLSGIRVLARAFPALKAPSDKMEARLDCLAKRGVEIDNLPFAANFGRTSMEYYDGFVFELRAVESDQLLATGGRYDALTRVLGRGAEAPAVGAVLRPAAIGAVS